MTLHVLPRVPRTESTCRAKAPSTGTWQDAEIILFHRRGYSIEGICIALKHDRRVVLAALRREVL